MFTGPNDIRLQEILISKEDLIVKILKFLQFWKQTIATKSTVVFIIKSLRNLIELAET